MRRFLSSLALGVGGIASALTFGSAGCDTGPQPPGPIPLADFRTEMEVARCEFAVACGNMPDLATCTENQTLDRETLQLLADVAFGLVTYDEQGARDCTEAVRAAPCLKTIAEEKKLRAACAAAFTGLVPTGEPCFVNGECSTGYCDLAACQGGGCCEGACAADPGYAQDGEDCSTRKCDEGLYCIQDSMFNGITCAPANGNGETCGMQQYECGELQQCDPDAQQCYVLALPGQQCNPLLDYQTCLAFNQECDPSGVCGAAPGPGQPCGKLYHCLGYATCTGANCVAKPKLGEMCDDQYLVCLGDLFCNNGVCDKPSPPSICAFGLP